MKAHAPSVAMARRSLENKTLTRLFGLPGELRLEAQGDALFADDGEAAEEMGEAE